MKTEKKIKMERKEMKIVSSTKGDIDSIFELYEKGTVYQKSVAEKHWRGFERSLVEEEIKENRQWKIIMDGQIACVFVITFSDPILWKEKNNDLAIYIHRIATHPDFRGNSFVMHIVDWVKKFGKESGKKFIRMDTGSGNDKLNNYYIHCGFKYLGVIQYGGAENMPEHYKKGSSSLFEIEID